MEILYDLPKKLNNGERRDGISVKKEILFRRIIGTNE